MSIRLKLQTISGQEGPTSDSRDYFAKTPQRLYVIGFKFRRLLGESTITDTEEVQKSITSYLNSYRYLCFHVRSVNQTNGMVVDDMFRRVCSSDQIKEDTMNFFVVDHIEVIVGRKGGKLFAFNNSCPHRGASLSKGELKDTRIVCYMHGYEYDVFTGKLQNMKSWKKESTWMEQNPEWRKSGNLIIYSVVEENGNIFLSI